MLTLPQRVNRSVNSHNSDPDVFCDWIEANVLFDEERLSRSDIVDYLIDEQIYDYDSSDFCNEFVDSAWRELTQRMRWIGDAAPIRVERRRLVRTREWRDVAPHSFCLVLALAPYYSGWEDHFGHDKNAQGLLFEELTREAAVLIFPGWTAVRTGWSGNNTLKLAEVAKCLAADVYEDVGNLEKWSDRFAQDEGLDVYWHRRFEDARGGHPVFLAQCASGANWVSKRDTPSLPIWNKLIDWKCPPCKAFALPFALSKDEFTRRSGQISGVILDRYRLVAPSDNVGQWISDELWSGLIGWLARRILWLRTSTPGYAEA